MNSPVTEPATQTRLQSQQVCQQASRPEFNATIRASAGTGKTYLLITRLVRLLLSGCEPSALLAITFTNKAAAEMQYRLQQRLLDWVQADDVTLHQQLTEIGVTPNEETLLRARLLHEQLLRNDRQPRITTFHAFCQDILRRFPLEANVPPGFILLENTGLLMQQAWDGLWYKATQDNNSPIATVLQQLLMACGGIENCRKALFEFLHHRSDWWAFTSGSNNSSSAQWASAKLRQQLEISSDNDPDPLFFGTTRMATMQHYLNLLSLHQNKTNRQNVTHLETIIKSCQQSAPDYTALMNKMITVFFTTTGNPRVINASNARAKAMGNDGQQQFLHLHHEIKEALMQIIDQRRRLKTWRLSTAWYLAGQQLIDDYQKLKQAQRWLDFTDLEWCASRLLNDEHHSHWIQYKLDQRINHILIDEFQDTNPTQWQLLLPLLQELAAHNNPDAINPGQAPQHSRSIFLVGDEKQSIYRFRRADPRLFDHARDWLTEQLGAKEYPLTVSWRSSPAIIDVVNRLFDHSNDPPAPTAPQLPGFQHHDTHRQDLYGQVEMLTLIPYPAPDMDNNADNGSQIGAIDTPLRNPLMQPRILAVNEQHLDEGRQIARHIHSLLHSDSTLAYADIMILQRHRTHLHDLEQALREAGIPYVGNGKKTLLDTLEIQDMVALLQVLVSPANNLALAQVLRSPLFSCSDDDLLCIAQQFRRHKDENTAGTADDWMTALLQLSDTEDSCHDVSTALKRAAHWLPRWHQLTRQLPIHDLLDRIYSEANVEACFRSAFPEHLRPRVQANLTRFLELALQIDSGRYPSLPAFLNQLQRMQQHDPTPLSQASPEADNRAESMPGNNNNAIQILTIHAAKGLEARVVYLCDSGYKKPPSLAWQALIDWPSHANRPDCFVLTGRDYDLDDWSRSRIEFNKQADQREDSNLLYVALTRARQQLIISGCAHKGDTLGWYQHIAALYAPATKTTDGRHILSQYRYRAQHNDPAAIPRETPAKITAIDLPQGLTHVWNNYTDGLKNTTLRPSQVTATNNNKDSAGETIQEIQRGIAIHRLLELCTSPTGISINLAMKQLAAEQILSQKHLQTWRDEVSALLTNPQLQHYFNPDYYQQARNEVSLHFEYQGQFVHGIIDRLVFHNDLITIIDYKTQRHANHNNIKQLATAYAQQMQLYTEGVRQLWPDKKLCTQLIFTACAEIVIIQ